MRFSPLLIVGVVRFYFCMASMPDRLYRTNHFVRSLAASVSADTGFTPSCTANHFSPSHRVTTPRLGFAVYLRRSERACARLPSVFAATLAVVLMHGLFRRVLGERAALLMALVLPCSVLWLDKVPT